MECELPAFYATEEVCAAKVHKCCECIAPIEVGEKHLICTGKWDGTIDRYRQHLLCAQACMMVRDEFNDDCIGFGQLFEWGGSEAYGWMKDSKTEGRVKDLRNMIAKIIRRERA